MFQIGAARAARGRRRAGLHRGLLGAAVLLVVMTGSAAASAAEGAGVEWLVVGPFDRGRGSAWVQRDFIQDAGGEADVQPAMDQIAGGKQWRRFESGSTIDLIQALGDHQDVVAYVARTIQHPEGGLAALRIHHDDGAKVWLNGRPLGVYGIGEHVVPVRLNAGQNLILAKVSQGGGGWDFGVTVDRFVRTNVATFSPNDDGVNDEVQIFLAVDEPVAARVRIRDASNNIIRQLRDGQTVHGIHDPVVWDGRNSDGETVPDGDYTIEASIRGAPPQQTQVTVRTTLELRRRSFAHLDNWFPTGVFYDGNRIPPTPEEFRAQCRDMREHHMDTIVFTNTYLQRNNVVDDRGRNWMLDIAAAEGIKVMLPIYHGPLGGFVRGEGEASEYEAITPLRRLLRQASRYPAVAGYITADEPGTHLAHRLKVTSRVIEHLDPRRPAIPIIVGLDRTWVHQRTADYPILFIDPYAASYGRPEGDFTMSGFGYPHLDLGDYIDFARATAGSDRRLWTLLQTHNFAQQLREPTPAEVRAMSWIALAHGSKGLFYFVYQSQQGWRGLTHNGKPTDRYRAAAEVAKLIQDRAGRILLQLNHDANPVALSDSNQPTDVQTFEHETSGEKYLVVVNLDVKQHGAARIRLLNPELRPVDVIRDRQPVKVADDTYLVPWTQPGEGTILRLASPNHH